jgi:16S rRNA (adenine1518-N6/adenine1519-N6)-dimethyltransferase
MDVEQLKNLLKRNQLSPNFTYGQNFLLDDFVLQDMADAAGVGEDSCVLEIGPGIGNLTELLLGRAKFVLSIEKDKKFLPILKSLKKEHKNFRYEIADVLEYDFQSVFKEQGCKEYMVVANIPYYITGKIIQMLLKAEFPPTAITILVQKEVAYNIIAPPGRLSILAISVQLFGDAKIIQKVQARSFYPAPKVDSAVLQITLHDKPKYDIGDEKKFFGMLRACFSGKRKQLHNTLVNNLHLEKEEAFKILSDLKIDPATRPQELTIEQWVMLNDKIEHE